MKRILKGYCCATSGATATSRSATAAAIWSRWAARHGKWDALWKWRWFWMRLWMNFKFYSNLRNFLHVFWNFYKWKIVLKNGHNFVTSILFVLNKAERIIIFTLTIYFVSELDFWPKKSITDYTNCTTST